MQVWDQLLSAVCRPFRIEYRTQDLLGGYNGSRIVGRTVVSRQDFTITNHKDQRLQCSYWQGDLPGTSTGPLPAVIYCHCNSGSRLDAVEAIWTLVPLGVRVFALDFSGSGMSEGEYVTLGANEVEDLACLVQFIRDGGHTSSLALWGRSMGAVTAILYSERDPTVAGLILDSPFSRLTDLMKELVEEQNIPLWGLVGGTALKLMRRSVKKKAGFDITTINPLDFVPRAFTPALFAHARADTFVKAHHTQRLHAEYAGEKELMLFDDACDHNSPRPIAFYEAVRTFMARALHLAPDVSPRQQAMLHSITRLMPEEHAGQTASVSPFQVPSDDDANSSDLDLQAALQASMQELSVSGGIAGTDDDSTDDSGAVAKAARSDPHAGRPAAASPTAAPQAQRRGGSGGAAAAGAAQTARGGGLRDEDDALLQAAIDASLATAAAERNASGGAGGAPAVTSGFASTGPDSAASETTAVVATSVTAAAPSVPAAAGKAAPAARTSQELPACAMGEDNPEEAEAAQPEGGPTASQMGNTDREPAAESPRSGEPPA